MIKDFEPSKKKSRVLIARELAASLAIGLMYPFGLWSSAKTPLRKKDQRTLVLLHGYAGNRSTLYPLAAYLRLRGINRILFYDYPSRFGAEQAAIGLREFLRKNVQGGRVDLVCHSMGGVVARIYLQLLGGERRVDHCITLGTPHKGTYNAYWIPTRVGDELRPDSVLIKKLNETQDQLKQVKIISIIGGSDNIILPRVFSTHVEAVHIPDTGHLGLLVSKKVMEEVARRLTPSRYDINRISK
jgi:hypothetical protein